MLVLQTVFLINSFLWLGHLLSTKYNQKVLKGLQDDEYWSRHVIISYLASVKVPWDWCFWVSYEDMDKCSCI